MLLWPVRPLPPSGASTGVRDSLAGACLATVLVTALTTLRPSRTRVQGRWFKVKVRSEKFFEGYASLVINVGNWLLCVAGSLHDCFVSYKYVGCAPGSATYF